MLRDTAQKLLRTLVAAQVAVIEHEDEDIGEHKAIDALDLALKEAQKLARALRREDE